MKKTKFDKNLTVYYISSFFWGLKFLIPIWLIWYTRFVDISTVGLLEAVGFVIAMLLEVPTGAFADIFGRKTSIIIGKVGVAAGGFIAAFAWNSTIFITAVIIWGIFSSFISGSSIAFIYDHLKEKGDEKLFRIVSSRASTILRIGIIIGSFTGGFLFKIWEPLPYFLYGITNIVEALIWIFADEPKVDSEHYSVKSYLHMMRDGWLEIIKSNYTFLITVICIILLGVSMLFREYYNYSFALDLGMNGVQQSYLFGVSAILKMIMVMMIGPIILKFRKNIVILGYFGIFTFVLVLAGWATFWTGIIIILMVEMITAAAPIIGDTYSNEEYSSKHRATANSFMNMFVTMISAIGVWGGMGLVYKFKSPTVYVWSGVLLFLVLVIIGIALAKIRKQPNLGKNN